MSYFKGGAFLWRIFERIPADPLGERTNFNIIEIFQDIVQVIVWWFYYLHYFLKRTLKKLSQGSWSLQKFYPAGVHQVFLKTLYKKILSIFLLKFVLNYSRIFFPIIYKKNIENLLMDKFLSKFLRISEEKKLRILWRIPRRNLR